MTRDRFLRVMCVVCGVLLMNGTAWAAQAQGSLRGAVVDPLGAVVANASVTLLRRGQPIGETTTGGAGEFVFEGLGADRYQVRVASPGFEPRMSEAVFVGAASAVSLGVDLSIGPLQQDVVVTASAGELPASRTGAPVTVIGRETLDAIQAVGVLDALRLVPGSQVVQVGGRGGAASMFVRGGNSNFNKVLIDGLAANDIGGYFDFSGLSADSVEQIEVLRQSNSVQYGSDALNGVISIETPRGRTRTPELSVALDGGSLGTVHQTASIGGVRSRVDYFSQFSHFETDNDVPNSDFRNRTFAGRLSAQVGGSTDLSGTFRRVATDEGAPNAFDVYGIADDARQDGTQTYVTVAARSQLGRQWQSIVRFGAADQTTHYVNPSPTGDAFDPFGFGANYLGRTVTLTGAGGASVTGQAILDFGGTYPSVYNSRMTRQALSGQTTYQATPDLAISGGARFEREAAYADPDDDPSDTRHNGGVFVEGRGTLLGRVHASAGLGYERNEAFESAVTPRVSVAVYLRPPSPSAAFGETRLVFNAGTGIKAPSVMQEQSSLFGLVQTTPAGAALEPIGPERSRHVDVGVEQGFAAGLVRARVTYFDNEFRDLIEYVAESVLPQLGVAPEVAAATGFGAYVNSSSFRARGVETMVEAAPGAAVRIRASYTFVDAEVIESLASGALDPAINPAFPATAIGAFSPLVGARPFRRPAHSGSLLVSYARGPAMVALSGYLTGRSDDSTFATDAFFGNSLLLPNAGLVAAYQKIDLSGAYQLHPRLRGYVSVENVLDQSYAAAYGYPSLPLTVRAGARLTLGGE